MPGEKSGKVDISKILKELKKRKNYYSVCRIYSSILAGLPIGSLVVKSIGVVQQPPDA